MLTSKDDTLLKTLHDVGYVNEHHATKIIGVGKQRLKNFHRDGIVESRVYFDSKTKALIDTWCLTPKGVQLVRRHYNLTSHYKSQSIRHDLALADRYLCLTEEERSTWRTEKSLRMELRKKLDDLYRAKDFKAAEELRYSIENHLISPVDGGYEYNGKLCGVEILTSNYGKQELAAKQEFANYLNMHYSPSRI